MRSFIRYAALAATLPAATLGAQSISSTLIVSEANVPAPNARVWLLTTRGQLVDSTRSDAQGRFTVTASRPGNYVLSVRRIGYFPEETDPLRLEADAIVRDTVFLLSARVLQPVDVIVRREVGMRFGVDTRTLSSSNVITPEEIDRFRHVSFELRDLLMWNATPSLFISRQRDGSWCYRIRFSGCARVYVDGMLWGTDAWIPVEEIESVVVIPGSAAFARFGSSTGVIAVFTRIWSGR